MKEQIRSNEAMQQLNNAGSPRMVDDLTASTQRSYPRGGEIFMAEPGQGEIQASKQPASQPKQDINPQANNIDARIALEVLNKTLSSTPSAERVSPEKVEAARQAWQDEYIKGRTLSYEERQVVEEAIKRGISPESPEAPKFKKPDFTRAGSQEEVAKAREAWRKHNEGKNVAEGERQAQKVLIAMGISPGDAREEQARIQLAGFLQKPEIQREYVEKAANIGKLLPEQEMVRQRREEAHETAGGPRMVGQLDKTGVTNTALLQELNVLNNLIQARGNNLEILTRGLETVVRLNGSVPADQKQVVIDRVTQPIREQRAREDAQRQQQEKEYVYRETGQRQYSIEELLTNREARDWAVNNLFAGVDSRPHIQFQQAFNPLTYGARYESLMDIIRNASIGRLEEIGVGEGFTLTDDQKRELAEDLQRYQAEIRVREPLHNVNSILYAPSVEAKPLFDFMQQFSSELGDLAHRMPGVRQMMDIYEQALREDMRKNDGYLTQEAVLGKVETSPDGQIINVRTGEAEEIAKSRFKERNAVQRITIKTADGKSEPYNKTFENWEIDRIFTISRGMLLMSQRLISLAAESKLPNKPGASQIGSSWLQDVLQGYSPYVHLLGKYGVTEKSLAAYLYKTNEGTSLLKNLARIFVTPWSTNDLKKAVETLVDKYNPFEMLESSEMRYLARLNPNRAGDLFTWITWRLGDKPGMLTMSTDFLEKGGERMLIRVKKIYGISETIALEKESESSTTVDYKWNLSEDDRKNPSKKKPLREDIITANIFYHLDTSHLTADFLPENLPEKFRDKDWKNIPKSEWPQGLKKICMENIFNYLNEYSNWIGTAVQLEKLRGDIDKQHSSKPDEIKEAKKAVGEAKSIIEQMVRLQPHRLYLVSKNIKNRVDVLLADSQEFQVIKNRMMAGGMKEGDVIPAILDALSLVESNLLQNRETLLDNGKTFDKVELDFNADSYRLGKREDESYEDFTKRSDRFYQSLVAARIFAEKVSGDFTANKDQYDDEFIFKREAMHGFVLWSGDVPVDEFNMSKLGGTGAFARRARDGRDQAAAAAEEIKLLVNLSSIKTPEQLIQALRPIYQNISSYDPGKAKQAIADKLEGFAKFFAADWRTDVPIVGLAVRMLGRPSMAEIVFGKGAPAWGSAELRSLVVQAHDGQMITDDKFEELKSNLFAGNYDITRDAVVTLSQLIAVALLIYLAQRSLQGK